MAPRLVLLHGFTHTGASWEPVVAALGEKYGPSLRPLAPDIRGHGSASEREPVTLDAVLADLASVAREEFRLAGYSMGGRVALHAALNMPGRVRRLSLIGASPGVADATARRERRVADERLAAEMEQLSIQALADRWAQLPVLAGQPGEVREAARRDRLRNTPAGLARALRGLGTGALPSLWDRLGELTMPVVLIVGERDVKFRAIADAMAGAIPACEVVVLAGTGHAAHLEHPAAVADILAG